MPAIADAAAAPSALAPAAEGTSGHDGPNSNPSTGLSTDYLNHFAEALMILELISTMPECANDLRNWKPKTYTEHFADSRFSNRGGLIAAYNRADPAVRRALDRNSELLNAMTERSCELILQHAGTAEAESIARRALERLRPLISRTAAIIHGDTSETAERQDSQGAVDAMFGR